MHADQPGYKDDFKEYVEIRNLQQSIGDKIKLLDIEIKKIEDWLRINSHVTSTKKQEEAFPKEILLFKNEKEQVVQILLNAKIIDSTNRCIVTPKEFAKMIVLLEREEKIYIIPEKKTLHDLLKSFFNNIGSRQIWNTNLGLYRDRTNKFHNDELIKYKKELLSASILQ